MPIGQGQKQKLDKITVARRQLVEAIRLLFENRDPVTVYSLATNAQEILSTLCECRGVTSLRTHIARPAGLTDAQVQATMINPARNFFKHANTDPDGILDDFRDEDCDPVILIACVDLLVLEGKSPIEVQVFVTWYAALYPEKFPDGSDWKLAAERKFPGLRELPREEQKRRAVRTLKGALANRALMAHPETDATPVSTWYLVQT